MLCPPFWLLAALPTAIRAAAWDVNIGDGSLTFDPNNITAQTGDLINFHFVSARHSVAQSTFDKPCVPLANGIWSGVSVASGPSALVYQLNLTNTNSLWLYCAVGMHCPAGMAMVINPPSNETIDAYLTAAQSAVPAAPSVAGGGNFVAASAAASSSTSSASSTAASTGKPTKAAGRKEEPNVPLRVALGGLCVVIGYGLS